MKKSIVFTILGIFLLSLVQAVEFDNSLESVKDNEIVKVNIALSENAQYGFFGIQSKVDRNETISELNDKYEVEYIAQTFNAITLEVNGRQLDELKSRKDISEIKKAIEFNTFLQDSKTIVNSSLSNSLNIGGINLSGQGQTVCIIDSGINYTHSAFGGCTTTQYLAGNCSKVIGGYAYYNPVNVSNNYTIMGDSNHGTHVAGIVVGMVPESKLVIMKGCGPTTACDGNAVIDSINWCVSNSAAYNISVISMSLGSSTLYNAHCDSEIPQFTSAINSAIAKNISVIAATGNDGNNTHIALPACITNVTAVSSTDKDDSISSFSNRNSLIKLLATGGSINSTILNGGYGSMSGTSMATPHVSGAFLIINQLINYLNISKSPKEIENIFFNNGKNITDNTGVNYTRINIYNSVLSLDSIKPEINLISPEDNLQTINNSILLSANVSDWELVNLTFQIKNSSNNVINETLVNISGKFNESSLIIYNLSNGTYNFTVYSTDSKNNVGNVSRTFTITNSNITLISPINGYSITSSSSEIIFNFSIIKNFTNCSLMINSATVKRFDILNYSQNQNTSYTLNSGTYNWNITCFVDDTNETSITSSLTLNAPVQQSSSGSGGGGGGGGAASAKFNVASTAMLEGYSKELKRQEVLKFDLSGNGKNNHSLTVDFVGNSSINFTIRSTPLKLSLNIGEEVNLNLSSDLFYDLYVKLESIRKGNANITIKKIYQPILIFPEKSNYTGEIEFNTFNETMNEKDTKLSFTSLKFKDYVIISLIVSVAIFFIAFILHYRQKRKVMHSLKVRFNKLDF